MNHTTRLLVLLCFASASWSCGGQSEGNPAGAASSPSALPFGMPQNASFPAPPGIEVVDHQKLKEAIPESLPGWKRTDLQGQKVDVMGYKMSTGQAKFKNDARGSVHIQVSDIGGLVGPSQMAVAAWMGAEIDKQTETGYEKTTKYKGHKAFEKVDRERNKASLAVIVARRFVVQCEGSKIDLETVKSIMDRIDLSAVSSLK